MIDINLANQILSEEIVNTEKKSDIIKLALSILENKFQADFTVRDEAVKSASDAQQLVNKKDGEINQLLSDLQEHKNVIKERGIEKENLVFQLDKVTVEKNDLIKRVNELESSVL